MLPAIALQTACNINYKELVYLNTNNMPQEFYFYQLTQVAFKIIAVSKVDKAVNNHKMTFYFFEKKLVVACSMLFLEK